MTKLLLRFINEYRDRHGKIRRYVRRPGFKRVALPGEPGSPEFMEAYGRAIDPKSAPRIEVGADRVKAGTIADLVARYYRSTEFLSLKVTTKSTYRSIIEPFREDHGEKRVAMLERRHVKDILAKKVSTPTAANNLLKRLHQLMVFAIDIGMRADDPTIGMKGIRITTGGHPMWTADHIAAFRKKHPPGSQARLAMELAFNTMQGRSDLVRIGRPHLQGGHIAIRRLKTGAAAEIPILPELQVELDRLPPHLLTFLMTALRQDVHGERLRQQVSGLVRRSRLA